MQETQNLMYYYCGGAGVNIGRKMADLEPTAYTRDTQSVMVDTSSANVRDGLEVVRLGNREGSGGVRKTNADDIIREVPGFLNQYRPATFNVVVFSAAGGSGSAIGPSIVSELLNRGKSVVAVVIGTSHSQLDMHNTINTIKSLEAIAHTRQKPVVIRYVENDAENTRDYNDKRVMSALVHFGVLFSDSNWELDTEDLHNWLNYTKLTDSPPRLVTLSIVGANNEYPTSPVLTAVTLTETAGEHPLPGEYVHQYVGRINHEHVVAIGGALPVHYLVTDGIEETFSRLTRRLKSIRGTAATLANRSTLLEDDDISSNGLVF